MPHKNITRVILLWRRYYVMFFFVCLFVRVGKGKITYCQNSTAAGVPFFNTVSFNVTLKSESKRPKQLSGFKNKKKKFLSLYISSVNLFLIQIAWQRAKQFISYIRAPITRLFDLFSGFTNWIKTPLSNWYLCSRRYYRSPRESGNWRRTPGREEPRLRPECSQSHTFSSSNVRIRFLQLEKKKTSILLNFFFWTDWIFNIGIKTFTFSQWTQFVPAGDESLLGVLTHGGLQKEHGNPKNHH